MDRYSALAFPLVLTFRMCTSDGERLLDGAVRSNVTPPPIDSRASVFRRNEGEQINQGRGQDFYMDDDEANVGATTALDAHTMLHFARSSDKSAHFIDGLVVGGDDWTEVRIFIGNSRDVDSL